VDGTRSCLAHNLTMSAQSWRIYAPVGSSNIQTGNHSSLHRTSTCQSNIVVSEAIQTLHRLMGTTCKPFPLLRARHFERYTYDSEHGFLAYDRNGIFDPTAAMLSWERTVVFLRKYLGPPAPVHRLAPATSADINERGLAETVGDHLMFHGH